MFATRTKIATSIVLLALACAVQAAPNRIPLSGEKPAAADYDPMFPDGIYHDFGRVKSGTIVKHSFRIVNTSNLPFRIVSVSVSMNHALSAWATKEALMPNEDAKIEIALDTRHFIGKKNSTLFVRTGDGKTMECRFLIAAESRTDQER